MKSVADALALLPLRCDIMGKMKALIGDQPYRMQKELAFDGSTYISGRDHERLSGQLGRVYDAMKDGQWRTLNAVILQAGGTAASVSARLRDLRKHRYGAHNVERRYVEDGIWEYRIAS